MSQFDKPFLRLSSTVTIKKGVATRPHRKDDGITIPERKLNLRPPTQDYGFTERPEAGARAAGYAILAVVSFIIVLIVTVAL